MTLLLATFFLSYLDASSNIDRGLRKHLILLINIKNKLQALILKVFEVLTN